MYGIVKGDTYYKREHERTKLKMSGGAWTINMAEVNDSVKNIIYKTDKGIYKIEYDKAVKKGFYRNFQGETKLVVPEKEWEFEDVK